MCVELSELKKKYRVDLMQEDYDLIKSTARGIYLEIGTMNGGSAYIASFGADEVYTIDCDTNQPKLFQEKYPRENIRMIYGRSEEIAEKWKRHVEPIEAYWLDVLFIDGDHNYESIKQDLECWTPFLKEGGHLMVHDMNPEYNGVIKAVGEFLYQHHCQEYLWPTGYKYEMDAGSSIFRCRYSK